ncbi:MAG: outer membrane protein assembly factor BamD [Actinomycetia bacterium]|nr:outer membrane protein assembly factor BamD [Actinomycetes bacterium]
MKKRVLPGSSGVSALIILSLILFQSIFIASIYAETGNGISQKNIELQSELKYDTAQDYYIDRKYTEASREFKEYLELYPNGSKRIESMNYIIIALKKAQEYLAAVRYYNILLKENPVLDSTLQSYFELGLFLVKIDYTDDAKKIFNWFLKTYPDSLYEERAKTELALIEKFSGK